MRSFILCHFHNCQHFTTRVPAAGSTTVLHKMADIRRVGDAGVHTVEGNVAGNRAVKLTKQRDAQKAEYEAIKNKIKEDNNATIGRIDDKFNAATDIQEQEFRRKTVGLVTAGEFRKAREEASESRLELQRAQLAELEKKHKENKVEARELKRKKIASSLSFEMDDGAEGGEEEDITSLLKAKKRLKDPTVDTSYLPDRERDREINEKKEALRKEWLAQQEAIKNEMLQVVYSYWDGSGHRKSIEVRKGTTIGKFLEAVKAQLSPEFHELRTTNPDDLVYVKEDLIIPHHYSFYDLIVTKARGKSGPLFHFDVHDDVRLVGDATVEKDESHPGKVAERRWYERNKHIFPASRWEVYDPKVDREGVGYTIHGAEVNAKPK